MGKLKKRKGYTALPQNNWAIPTNSTSITTITSDPNVKLGSVYYGTFQDTINWTSSGTTITLNTPNLITHYNGVQYESLSPIAINDLRTGKRLIVWEPS